jgi:hypothetical protein
VIEEAVIAGRVGLGTLVGVREETQRDQHALDRVAAAQPATVAATA